MAGDHPTVYFLYGEDEFTIAGFLAGISAKVGDPSTASMNTTRLEGSSLSIEELRSAAFALPFLASRRLVVVNNPQTRLNNEESRRKFLAVLGSTPPSTALVLIEHRPLKEEDWLLKWARAAGGVAYIREFPPQNEGSLARWLQEQAVELGGKITPPAAGLLARMVVPDKRMAYQELNKLLAYVNYTRAVEPEDVETLSVPVFHEKIFALVDSLAVMDGKKASGLLRRFLDDEDPQYVMAMVVRQLRLLLLAREVLDQGGNERDVFSRLKLKHPREAEKIAAQARRFTMDTLEGVLRKLLDIDEAIKTGRIEDEVALETLVAGFTTP